MASLFPDSPSFYLTETVVCALLTAAVWFCSLIVFFPLFSALVCSSRLRNKIHAFLQSNVMTKCQRYRNLTHYRKKLFDPINENGDKSSSPLRILEIGVGSGGNFDFYPENHTLTTVDMNPEFGSYLRSELKKYPKINLEKVITAYAEDMSVIQDNEYDVVITTHLLCSVKNVDAVLNEIHRVLKEGGRFAMLDHIVYPRRCFSAYMIQQIMTPMWRIYFNGCNINRDILKNVKNSRFSEISFRIYYPDFLDLFFRPQLIAVCTK